MIRIPGILKVSAVLLLDFLAVLSLSRHVTAAILVTALIAACVWLGGRLAAARDGGVRADKLPEYDRSRLDAAKALLAEEVRQRSAVSISRLKLFLIPGDEDMQATAYGANCVSVTQGLLDNMDPVTLNAVLSHEASHILHSDPEFNRAVFCSVTLVMAALSVASALTVVVIFLIFLILSCFRSFLGVLAFKGTTGLFKGFFRLLQRTVVLVYRTLLGVFSRSAEYRCDRYACELGYGVQLAHFLELSDGGAQPRGMLTEMLYRSHPPVKKRIARIEDRMNRENLELRDRV